MKRTLAILAAIAFFAVCSVYADYGVEDRGSWPASWPAELEPLRKQARTLEGPLRPSLHYAIPFTKREDFEAAWPHLLKVKTKGAPIILRHAPNFFLGGKQKAGLCIHTPPAEKAGAAPKAPAPDAKDVKGARDHKVNIEETTYIELVVDGVIVDLNRIPLPADTPFIDERFKDNKAKQ